MKKKYKVITELKQLAGIYIITCNQSDKVYIGESFNMSKRIIKHFSHLRSNTHHNPILQNIYNKYGEESLSIDVLEFINSDNKENLDKILKEKEVFYQSKYKTCINFDKNGYAWSVNATEEQKEANKEQLNSIRSLAIEACQTELIIYNIITKEEIKVPSLQEAEKYIEQKHIYRNIKDKVYLPYKGTYVAFVPEEFNPNLVLNTKCEDNAGISGEYKLYNMKTGEIIRFPSKTQFSLHFSSSKNDKLYDRYLTFIDNNFLTAKEITSINDLLNTDFVFHKTSRSIKTCKISIYLNALKNYTTNNELSKQLNVNRHLITDILKTKPLKDRISELEEVIGYSPNLFKYWKASSQL